MKFGRKPRVWSITQVHDLWIKCKKRYEKRNSDFRKFVEEEVFTSVKPDGNGKYNVYYTLSGSLKRYSIEKNKVDGRWSFSDDWVRSTSKKELRDRSIDIISGNHEIGEKLKDLDRLRSFMYHGVAQILNRMIEDKIRKDKKHDPWRNSNETLIISINSRKYLFQSQIGSSKIIKEIKEKDIIELE